MMQLQSIPSKTGFFCPWCEQEMQRVEDNLVMCVNEKCEKGEKNVQNFEV